MKIFYSVIIAFIFSCCKNDNKTIVEKKIFIVSQFNNNIEKKYKEAKLKDPELSLIQEMKEYDYPKGAVNFIILKNRTVYFYNEELIGNWCGWNSNHVQPQKRKLRNDSLHRINFNQIYTLLQSKCLKKNMKNDSHRLFHLSFSFEDDTVKNFDIYKLLQDIDSLGYHSYTLRKLAPFERQAINHKR
nr:hypothetical protein [uncultured Chryseobacterium sp.]